jgi:hydrogenase maturation protease
MRSIPPLEQLRDLIKSSKNSVFVCIGNELRGDDQVGIYLGNKLRKTALRDRVIMAYATPESYIDDVLEKNPEIIFFLDAIQIGQKPGMIAVQEIRSGESLGMSISTHSIPIEVLTAVIQSTSSEIKFFVVGIQIKQVEFGKKMSKAVVEAAKSLLEIIEGATR